jgi:hypothetical protein
MMLHERLADLDTFRGVVRTARCTLGVRGSSLGTLEPEEVTVGSELTVVAMHRHDPGLDGGRTAGLNVFTAPEHVASGGL